MHPSTTDTYICKEFYGFRDMPFSMAVDGNQNNLYLSQNHETSLAILVSSLDRYMAITQMVGVDGVGKTTLINYIYKHVQQDFIVGMVKGNIKSTQELLKQTLASFGHIPKTNGTDEMLDQLQHILNLEFENHCEQSSILVIDDADNMSFDALKGIEVLLELNSKSKQLLQLILVGKPELEQLLNTPKLQILSNTVRTLCSVKALTTEETQHYIQHRLNLAGVVDKTLFDEQVCSEIFKYSKGIPRKINSICDNALLRSSSTQAHRISTVLISEVANESNREGLAEQKQSRYNLDLTASPSITKSKNSHKSVLATGFVFAGIILVLFFLRERLFLPSENQKIEISHNVNRSVTRNNSDNIIILPPQKPEHLENLAQKEADPDKKPQKELTKNLLAAAEQHLRARRLATPSGENALEIYRGILEKEPSNEIALKGIKKIAQKYVALATRESRQGATSKARKYLEQAATLLPESDVIQKALNQTKKTQGPAEKPKMASKQTPDSEKKPRYSASDGAVTKLLAIAEQQLAESKFVFPKNDNAYKTYTKILSLSPTDKHAYAGLRRIANHYLILAKIQRAEGNIEKSKLSIVRGLKALPRHKKLVMLKKKVSSELSRKQEAVFAAFEIKKATDIQLENLLNQAVNQRKALHLTYPPGNNALESYNKALQIDPSNVNARKGLGSIMKHYQTIIGAALASGDTGLALAIANEGLAAFPKNQALLALRSNAMLQQESTVKKAEVPAKKKPKDNGRGLRSFGTF